MGVVTGPFSATLLWRIDSRTSGGRGSPKREIASEPTKYFSHSTSTPAHSMIDTTDAVTSGPMPSPGRSVILCWTIRPDSFQPLARFGERKAHWEDAGQLLEVRQLAETAADAVERSRDEVE